jgi:hypothetical protein
MQVEPWGCIFLWNMNKQRSLYISAVVTIDSNFQTNPLASYKLFHRERKGAEKGKEED